MLWAEATRAFGWRTGTRGWWSEPQRTQFAARPGPFPYLAEGLGDLPRAGARAAFGFAVEAMAERPEVVAAGVAGDEGGGIGAVDRILDLAQREHAGQS